MSVPSEYDPATCVTAGELREIGIPVPVSLPDVAWCPRSALRWACQGAETGPDSSWSLKLAVTFTEPMRWLQVDFTVGT